MDIKKLIAVSYVLFTAGPVWAGSHTWQFNEVFSDASGRVQFIELVCNDDPDEWFLENIQVSVSVGATVVNAFTFPADLEGSTADKFLLLATERFALLPGAPTPDYIIPENFFPLSGATIRYNPSGNYDTWTYGAGVIPTDGIKSVQFTGWHPFTSNDPFTTTNANNPTNYTGGTGSVVAICLDGDGDGFGDPGDPACPNGSATDCDDSNANVRPNALEQESANNCGDGLDNDCDSVIDCEEAGCATAVPACVPTVSEWGVLVLALLTLSAGSIMLRQRA